MQRKVTEERFKVVVRGAIEIVVALLITRSFGWQSDNYSWLYCSSLYCLAALRSIYLEKFDLFASIFLCCYMLQNLIVNCIDWMVFKGTLGFYEDKAFWQMFSYKLF